MSLKCEHCGIEATYSDANIMKIRDVTCEENTETREANGWEYTIEKDHNWVEQ